MVFKFECIDVQHAQIASLRLKDLSRRTVRLGKAVVTDTPNDRFFIRIYCEAMAYTCTPTDEDIETLEREYEK